MTEPHSPHTWHNRLRHTALRGLITCGLAVLLYLAQGLSPDGADGWYLAELVESPHDGFYYRSILTVELHRLVYRCVQSLAFTGWDAIALSSSIAGAIAIQALWMLRASPLFLAINILSGSFLVFVGHVENYAWVNAFFILSFCGIQRWLEHGRRVWPAMVCFMLAILSHMLALFYIPAFAYLLWKRRDFHPLEILLPALTLVVILTLAPFYGQLLGTDNGLERFVPWFHTWSKNHFFTFFSAAHLKMLAYFHQRAAIGGIFSIDLVSSNLQNLWYSDTLYLGIPIELPLLLFLAKRIQTLLHRFFLVALGCGLLWTTLWHPDWGPLDWDLFSQFAIPLHILLGYLVTHERTARQEHTDHPQP
jgi:hypothetical protein